MAEKTTIARPYAQAIFELAKEQGDLQGWSQMLSLAAAVIADETMVKLIDNPRVSKAQIVETFISVCGEKLTAAGQNTIRVLAANDRLDLLPEIAELYEAERANSEGTLEAEIISAFDLPESSRKELENALGERLGRKISLQCQIDKSLLGGAIVRAGDLVIDGSAVGRLNQLRATMLS